MPGTCAQCHNSFNAIGKRAQHLVTNASCESMPQHGFVCHLGRDSATGHIPTLLAMQRLHDAVKFVPHE